MNGAMTLADRIVVDEQGAIEQVGAPSRPYLSASPNLFVRGFSIGSPAMNASGDLGEVGAERPARPWPGGPRPHPALPALSRAGSAGDTPDASGISPAGAFHPGRGGATWSSWAVVRTGPERPLRDLLRLSAPDRFGARRRRFAGQGRARIGEAATSLSSPRKHPSLRRCAGNGSARGRAAAPGPDLYHHSGPARLFDHPYRRCASAPGGIDARR